MDNNDPDCGFNWTWSVWLCSWSFTINKHIDVCTQIKLTFTVRHVQRQLERNCHRRKRTETALKPRTYALSWKLSDLSNYTSLRTLTDKWWHTEELYHHSPQVRGAICAHASCSLNVYTTITQFKSQGEGPNWSLHTSPPMATCMAIRDEGSWMESIAHVAESPWCIHIYTYIMPCTDTRMQGAEMPPCTHTCI